MIWIGLQAFPTSQIMKILQWVDWPPALKQNNKKHLK